MNSDANSPKWIVAYTKPKHEKTVKDALIKNNFEVYLPVLKKRRKWSDRKKWIEFPLFSSYVFVKTQPKNSLFVVKTYGIVKIIKFGKDIAIVNEKDIAMIKRINEGGYKPRNEDYFIKGDPVIVMDGPLEGLVGEVIRIEGGKNRLIMRIDTIQQSISININSGFLKLLNNHKKRS